MPGLQHLGGDDDEAVAVRTEVPVAVRILQTWLGAAAVMGERTNGCVRVVEPGGLGEAHLRWWPVDRDAVMLVILDVEQSKFVDEVPVAAQAFIRGGT